MTQYKTYQEAKIANPESQIYHSATRRLGDKGFFSTKENATGFYHKCKPKDHCMTLKSFLASGRRAVKGDVIVGKDGKAIAVEAENVVNTPVETDCEVYVIKAKALENPAHEWVNGDDCVNGHHDYSGANKMTYIGAHPFVNGKHICLSELKGLVIVDSMWLRKPETPEQKLERQRLESAYHLACIAGAVGRWGGK